MPIIIRRRRSRLPTWASIGLACFFGNVGDTDLLLTVKTLSAAARKRKD
jgi:hypothetical protein